MKRKPRTLTPSEEVRLFMALLVQPFVAGGLAFLLFPVLLLDRSGRTLAGGFPLDVIDAARSVAIGAAMVAFAVTLLAAPVALWLMKRRQLSFPDVLLFGLAFGNLPLILGAVSGGTYGVDGAVRGVAFASLLGVAGAAAFWVIAVRRRRLGGEPLAE